MTELHLTEAPTAGGGSTLLENFDTHSPHTEDGLQPSSRRTWIEESENFGILWRNSPHTEVGCSLPLAALWCTIERKRDNNLIIPST